MKPKPSSFACLPVFTASLFAFVTWQSLANTIELDWTSSGFSASQITITTGDEVDIVNFDDIFDLQLTGSPAPNNFYSDIPPLRRQLLLLPALRLQWFGDILPFR